jgi:hypothetical protein
MIKGSIEKVECEPYQHTIKETGEVITLNHKYEYNPEEENVLNQSNFTSPVSRESVFQ